MGELDDERLMFINLHPQDLADPVLLQPQEELAPWPSRLVFEVTETEAIADFDHAAGVDLGRCASCGAWLMAVWYHRSTTYNVISKERAEYFLDLQGTPELRRVLKAWVD